MTGYTTAHKLPKGVTAEKLTMNLQRALGLVAQAELAGGTISGRDIGLRLGASETSGLEWRAQLLALGLVRLDGKIGSVTVLRLTEAGWTKVGGREAVPASPAKRRPCMSCGTVFLSTWSGHRLCDRCRTQSGEDSYRIAL